MKNHRKNYETQKRLKKAYQGSGKYYGPVDYRTWDWNTLEQLPENQHRYKNLNPYLNYKRYLKKHSNKKVRRYKGEISDGNSYRKIYDLWWNLY